MRNKVISTKKLFFPLKIIVIYLVFTLILYALGPFAWPTHHPIEFYLLNMLYIGMFGLGWYIGIKYTHTYSDVYSARIQSRLLNNLPFFLVCNLCVEFINIFRKFGYSNLDLYSLIMDCVYGIQNMGAGYNLATMRMAELSSKDVIGGWWMTGLNTIWGFVNFPLLLLGIFYYRQLRCLSKIIIVLHTLLIFVSYMAIGTNIGVFRLILAIIVFYWIKIAQKSIVYHKKHSPKFFMLVWLGIIFMSILFMHIMQSRGGILSWDSSSYNIGGIKLDMDSLFFYLLPESLYMMLVAASSYLTQGYYGMSLCLSIEWLPTFGLGSSMAIIKKLSEYVSDTIQRRTYQFRLTSLGWEEDIRWHTMYSWIANDTSFLGVIIIMFFIGLLFAMAYKDSIISNNPYAHIVVYYFALMAFFIPCNNQLFQSTYIMFSFILMICCWLTNRGRTKLCLCKKSKDCG